MDYMSWPQNAKCKFTFFIKLSLVITQSLSNIIIYFQSISMRKKILSKISLLFLVLWINLSFLHADSTDIWSIEFELNVDDFTPWSNKILGDSNPNAVDGVNFALGYIIQSLMVFIGWLALFVMTIWAWYMILHRGDDSSLSKWKEIFNAGILGLVVALFSYYMVSLLRYLIYSI